MENLIKMDDLGSSPISGNLHVSNIYRYLILTLKKIKEDRVDTSHMEHVGVDICGCLQSTILDIPKRVPSGTWGTMDPLWMRPGGHSGPPAGS